MFEGSRLSYVVPGYTGYIPKVMQNDPVQIVEEEPTYKIPGYVGYVPSQKSENMFGKTYGKITYTLSTGEYHQGQDVPPEERYTSMSQGTFVNQQLVQQRTAAEIVGVPNHVNDYSITSDSIQTNKFWGEKGGEGKETIQGLQQQDEDQGQQPKSFAQNVSNFYGDVEKESIKLNPPLPGYTGVNKRVQAANIFGQTYANSRKTAQQDQQNIDFERTYNFKTQSTIQPPIRR